MFRMQLTQFIFLNYRQYLFMFTLSIVIASASCSTLTVKKYRTDYTYSSKVDAFYKLHVEQTYPGDADRLCAMEGATLMVPTSDDDVAEAHALLKRFPDIGDHIWIGSDRKDHESAEEPQIIDLHQSESQEYDTVSSCEILTREGKIESTRGHNRHPFICKVNANDAPYDDRCRVYGTRYVYYESVGSCYKIPLIELSWYEAFAECRAEDAHLLILNSEAEHQAVWDLLRAENPYPDIMHSFFVGLKKQDGWKTIFGKSLKEAGYDVWSVKRVTTNMATCGAQHRDDGKYVEMNCFTRLRFICEKEVQ